MTDLLTNLLINSWSSHPHALTIGLDLAIKSTLLILLAIAAAAILGRGRILLRTALWNACLLGLLVLPATTIALPRLRIAVLPVPDTTAAVAFVPTPAPGPGIESTLAGANATYLATPPGTASVQSTAAPSTIKPVDTAKEAGPGARPTRTQADTPSWNSDWLATCILVYAAGILVVAVRLVCALVAVKTLRRSGQPVTESAWVDTFTIWTKRLEITWPVRLLHSPQVNVPLAFGWWRPVVMIPSDMMPAAGQGLRNSVLLHELAHVRRCDYLWQLLMRAIQIIYWPNPLIWLMARPLYAAREEASDALCVYHAGNQNEYRLTLLEVARSLVRRPVAALGIAMARSSRIARRLDQIDRGLRVSHCLAGRSTRIVLAASTLLVVTLVGASELACRNLSDDPSKRSDSAARLKQIARALVIYTDKTGNAAPSSLQTLVDEKIIAPETLISPVTPAATQPSYVLIPHAGERDLRDVIIYEHPANYKNTGTMVFWGDAHVAWSPMAEFQKALADTFLRLSRPMPTDYSQEAIDAALAQAASAPACPPPTTTTSKASPMIQIPHPHASSRVSF